MPNPFPVLKFVPRRPRLGGSEAVAALRGQLEPTWDAPPIQGLADLARWGQSVDVHPVALPNPYPSSWADVPFPADLWLVVHRLPYVSAGYYWIGDQAVAVVWSWIPLSASDAVTITISAPDATVLHTVAFTVADGPQQGVWYLPDARWDAGQHSIVVSVSATAQVGIIRSPGCLVPAELPSGWEAVPPGPRGFGGQFPSEAGRTGWGVSPSAGLISEWSGRYAGWIGYPPTYRTSTSIIVHLPSFPLIWYGEEFAEALNLPTFDDVGPCRVQAGFASGRRGAIAWQQYFNIDDTRPYASFLLACDFALVITNNGSTGESISLTVKEWTSGTILYAGTIAVEDMSVQPPDYRQVVPLPLADPGLGPDATWEVSATVTPSSSAPAAALRVVTRYRPVPFSAWAADGSRAILGGTCPAMRRPIPPLLAVPAITADPGALSASFPASSSPAAAGQLAVWLAAFAPSSPGWYRPSISGPPGASLGAICVEESRWVASGGVTVHPWQGPLPLLVECSDTARPTTAGTITVSLTRKTPAPATLGGTWTALSVPSATENWPVAWGAFAAPTAGRYRLTVAYTDHYNHATPDDVAPDCPRLCAYAAIDDPDVITGATVVHEFAQAAQEKYGGVMSQFAQSPPSYAWDGPFVVGLAPTGAWEGHAGQLARQHLTPAGAVVWSFSDPPEGLVSRIHDATGSVRMLVFRDGKWTGWHPTLDIDLQAGQALTVRAHGPRLAGDGGYGSGAIAGDLFAKVEALTVE